MTGEAESLPELSRMVRQLRTDVREDMAELKEQIRGLNVVHSDVYAIDKAHTLDKFEAIDKRFDRWRTGLLSTLGLLLTTAGVLLSVMLGR